MVTSGGLVGVLMGWAVTSGIHTLPLLGLPFKDESGTGDIHLHISRFAAITSTAVLDFIGLFAELWPAVERVAARSD